MKIYIVLVLILTGFISGIIWGPAAVSSLLGSTTKDEPTQQVLSTGVEQHQPTSSVPPEPTPTPVAPPVTITIPSIKVTATVEKVGLDAKNRMDVPKNFMNVGWYSLGYKPGEKGSAVMAGHFDRLNGDPAVFFNLDALKAGDTITVTDETGRSFTYRVTAKKLYAYNQVPLQEIFADSSKAVLHLITCDGVFNNNTKNYSQRLIVSSELVS